ncbi:MAG: peptide chain release factor N(5)-glutamine methyltransferase [Muribaculaceae bacterium]|nr:peptide chain release factor N(5)-glutamine methyltransferase [Muribaculaceae bacterium]
MKETLKKLHKTLYPIFDPGESDAIIRLIFHYLKGWSLTDMLIHQDDELSPYIKGKIDEILARLIKHEPIQYIIGEARFHGMDFKIKPGVLIPRPETDELVDIIIDENKNREDLRVLDLCAGSGCIAIALARNLPFSNVTAVDISPVAIEVAKENSDILHTKIKLKQEDIFQWTPSETFDIIVSNPPYIMDKEALTMEKNVLDYEPHEALFVRDENPLEFYNRIADIAESSLVEGGNLYLEINPLTVDSLKVMLAEKGFSDISVLKDTSAKQRFISCRK